MTNSEKINETEHSNLPTFILAEPIYNLPEGFCPYSRNRKKDGKIIIYVDEFK